MKRFVNLLLYLNELLYNSLYLSIKKTNQTISLEDGEYEVEAIVDKGVLTPKERKKHNVDYKILYCVKFLNYEE